MESEKINDEACAECGKRIHERIADLRTVFAHAAVGDFSMQVAIPDEEDEFTELYAGVSIMLDVINRQLEELRKHAAHEEELNAAKSEFVALVSHQLRTPLTVINWSLEKMTKVDVPTLNPGQKDTLANIESASKQMNALVETILDISRIELGTLHVEPKETDMTETIHECVRVVAGLAEAKHITLREKENPAALMIPLDLAIFKTVLSNIISNAVKYTPEHGTITIETSRDTTHVVIQVSDTGYGISLEDQPHIFTKLFRSPEAMKRAPEGSGLGLYMVKSLVEKTGGSVWFTSEKGQGTSFFVSYPLEGMKASAGDVRV